VRLSTRFVFILSAVFVLFAIVAGESMAGATTMPQLISTGSSFAGTAISQWQGAFNELDGGNVNFEVSSSILGLNEFCNQTIDFGASDLSYAAGQSDCDPTQVPFHYQYVPDVGGALALEYNLSGTTGKQITSLVLNASTIAGIFTGAIATWNNPAIVALNPGANLPDEPITAYYRSDPSEENYLLSDYLAQTDPSLLAAFQQEASVPNPGGGASAIWALFPNGTPAGTSQFPNLRGLVAVNGADADSEGPVHQSGGIAFVETAYAKNVGLPVASAVNEAGNAVQPTAEDSAVALEGATLNPDLTQNLSGVFDDPAADAYPLSSYSYLVTQCVQKQAKAQHIRCDGTGKATMGTAQGAELARFITYVACLGQRSMATLGYTPLPPNLVELDFQAAGRLPGGVTPPPPTPENCKNPTITGALNSISPVGGLLSQSSNGGSTLPVSAPVVGNAWVLAVRVKNSSTEVASISGGGVGSHWTKLARVGDAKQNEDLEEWLGPISKTGSSPITVQFSRGVSGTPVELAAQQFTNGTGDSTVWTGDTGAGAKNDIASSTITYPTLTPAMSGELYVGFSQASSSSSAGATTGFSYENASAKGLYVYGSNILSSVSPTASQQNGLSVSTGALIAAN
jgi:phosphate transport system substrate-binding protein